MIDTKSLHKILLRDDLTMIVSDLVNSNFDRVEFSKEQLTELHNEIAKILGSKDKKEILYLFKVTRKDNWDELYDIYDHFVVVAPCIQDAKEIHPGNERYYYDERLKCWKDSQRSYVQDHGWPSPEFLEVENIGIAADHLTYGTIISASFNKG